MLDDCTYNKAKISHHLSALCWFIKNHAVVDAEKVGDKEFVTQLNNLCKDLEKNIDAMGECMCSCEH